MSNAKAVCTIWLRDLIRCFREPSRIVGMLGQPLLYLLVVSSCTRASSECRCFLPPCSRASPSSGTASSAS